MNEATALQAIMEVLRSDLPPDHKVAAIKLVIDSWKHWYDNKYR